jgi:hypothetical protein
MDNSFTAYISTDDTVQGTLFSSGSNWQTNVVDTTTLNTGITYYLHILGNDAGGIAGFLGQFSLSGNNHIFSNGTTSLLTNTSEWKSNNTGWASAYTTPTAWGYNGVNPWGTQAAIATIGQWIWAGDNDSQDIAYFSTKITATSATSASSSVPTPPAFLLLCAGLLGLLGIRKKRNFTASFHTIT